MYLWAATNVLPLICTKKYHSYLMHILVFQVRVHLRKIRENRKILIKSTLKPFFYLLQIIATQYLRRSTFGDEQFIILLGSPCRFHKATLLSTINSCREKTSTFISFPWCFCLPRSQKKRLSFCNMIVLTPDGWYYTVALCPGFLTFGSTLDCSTTLIILPWAVWAPLAIL